MTTDLQSVVEDIRACRACAGVLPHTPRPVVRKIVHLRWKQRLGPVAGLPVSHQGGGHLRRDDPLDGQLVDQLLGGIRGQHRRHAV